MKFEEMGIGPEIADSLQKMGLSTPTEIQEKTIPSLREGKDVIGQSETGSGKTLAFAIPLLEKLTPGRGVQALILTPTRELAKQIKTEFEKVSGTFSVTTVYGGVGFEPQIQGLKRSEIIVATPGRMLDHLRQGNCNFSGVRHLVLDEADRMLEMGFIDDVEYILRHLPRERQSMLFSATMPSEIVRIGRRYLKDPLFVRTKQFVNPNLLAQAYYDCMDNEKFSLLVHLIQSEPDVKGMVFCNRKTTADLVANNLQKQGIKAAAIHGDLSQGRREEALEKFHSGTVSILVGTDVASRGLDIKGVTHIYNFNIPDKPEDYTHRIGRTARAGEKGRAISLISPQDYENFRRVTANIEVRKERVQSFQRLPFHTRPENDYRRSFPPRRMGNNSNYRRYPRRY